MKVINAIKVNAEGFILVALAYAAIYFLNNYLRKLCTTPAAA
jgi:hypothetical protein